MKLLMLGWELPPHNSGGLGVACYHMCKHLALQGVTIDFVVPYNDKHKNIEFMNVVPALPLNARQLQLGGGAYDSYTYEEVWQHPMPSDLRNQQQQYIAFVEDYVNTTIPDVIHAHDWLTFEAGIRAKALTGRPLVAHVHATEFDRSGEHQGNPLVHEIEYNGLIMADRIIAVSNITKDIIASNYDIPAEKIEVVHNAIDTDELQHTDCESTYIYLREMKKRSYKVVVSLGRLTVQKGLTYLLQAAARALQKNDKLLFLIAGSGEQRDELIQLSADLGIAHNVIFTGFLRGARWRDAYAIGDMFVMPSVAEPFGLTALEAAGYGNALLISKQCGVGELLKSVLKFDYWNIDRLADEMLAVAEHQALQQSLAQNVAIEFSRFSWDKVAKQCLEMYQRQVARVESSL